VVLMVDGDSYFHGAVLGGQKNAHGAQEDGMVRRVVEEVAEAVVAAEVFDLYDLHIQKYRALEAETEPHKHPCCLDCLQ
jgi:multimeric flavodoxin WrbA